MFENPNFQSQEIDPQISAERGLETEPQIEAEFSDLAENAERLKTELEGVEPERLDLLDEEGRASIYTNIKILVGCTAALIAIPLIASMIGPEMTEKLSEFNNTMHTLVEGNPKILIGVLSTAVTGLMGMMELESWKETGKSLFFDKNKYINPKRKI